MAYEFFVTNEGKRCKKGQIKVSRKGYTNKRGTKVEPTTFCATDRGKPGRGPKKIPTPHRGALGGPGYTDKPAKERRKLLQRHLEKHGYASTVSALQSRINLGSRTMGKHALDVFKSDKAWVQKQKERNMAKRKKKKTAAQERSSRAMKAAHKLGIPLKEAHKLAARGQLNADGSLKSGKVTKAGAKKAAAMAGPKKATKKKRKKKKAAKKTAKRKSKKTTKKAAKKTAKRKTKKTAKRKTAKKSTRRKTTKKAAKKSTRRKTTKKAAKKSTRRKTTKKAAKKSTTTVCKPRKRKAKLTRHASDAGVTLRATRKGRPTTEQRKAGATLARRMHKDYDCRQVERNFWDWSVPDHKLGEGA